MEAKLRLARKDGPCHHVLRSFSSSCSLSKAATTFLWSPEEVFLRRSVALSPQEEALDATANPL